MPSNAASSDGGAVASRLRAVSGGALRCSYSAPMGRGCELTADVPSGAPLCTVECLALALEPESRSTHCSFCGGALGRSERGACTACGLVRACARCRRAGAIGWHRLTECAPLSVLSSDGGAEQVSSLVLLVARLVLRRRHEEARAARARRRTASSPLAEFAVLDELMTHEELLNAKSATVTVTRLHRAARHRQRGVPAALRRAVDAGPDA